MGCNTDTSSLARSCHSLKPCLRAPCLRRNAASRDTHRQAQRDRQEMLSVLLLSPLSELSLALSAPLRENAFLLSPHIALITCYWFRLLRDALVPLCLELPTRSDKEPVYRIKHRSKAYRH